MDIDGFLRVGSVIPTVRPADIEYNVRALTESVLKLADAGAEVIVTPELGVTGYTCADLFGQTLLLRAAVEGLERIISDTSDIQALTAIGLPLEVDGALYNCAALICRGRLLAVIPKSAIPNYGEFYERRWFVSGANIPIRNIQVGERQVPFGTRILIRSGCAVVGTEICEDLWIPSPPSVQAACAGANIILNLSASNDVVGKHRYLRSLISQQSARLRVAYLYASAGFGESSTDLVFGGNAFIAEDGRMLAEAERFQIKPREIVADIDVELLQHERMHTGHFSAGDTGYQVIDADFAALSESKSELLRCVESMPFVPSGSDDNCKEIASIQASGLARRLAQLGGAKAVVGISGGLDSTLALLVTVRSFDMLGLSRKDIFAITMPGFATSGRTHTNAIELMRLLGVTSVEIPISRAATEHLRDLGHDLTTTDATYENAQARERTQVLMDYANMVGGIVIGTGDLSELALGWCTYNGDQMSMYGVNASVPKTLVRYLVRYFAHEMGDKNLSVVLEDILDTPVSPELIPDDKRRDKISQKTEDIIGPYELHDFFLFHVLRHGFSPSKIYRLARIAFGGAYTDEIILKWLQNFYKRFFTQQFKRSCMPDGPKVGSVCLSPRGDWRMPSDVTARLWLNDLQQLCADHDTE